MDELVRASSSRQGPRRPDPEHRRRSSWRLR